jgi:hypothetical protein
MITVPDAAQTITDATFTAAAAAPFTSTSTTVTPTAGSAAINDACSN